MGREELSCLLRRCDPLHRREGVEPVIGLKLDDLSLGNVRQGNLARRVVVNEQAAFAAPIQPGSSVTSGGSYLTLG